MRSILNITLLLLFASCSNSGGKSDGSEKEVIIRKDSPLAQKEISNPYASVDVSPIDISYFPVDYPILKMSGKASTLPLARVIYSRPHRQGRKIFGTLLKYDEPWRLGANEATEIEFFQPAHIQGKVINKGRYILYCIPKADKWTLVLNTNLFSWGLKPDHRYDITKFDVPVQPTPVNIEYFTMVFQKTDQGADLFMAWDDISARLPVVFSEK